MRLFRSLSLATFASAALVAAPCALAGTIVAVAKDGATLTLSLSKEEQKKLKKGDRIAVTPRTGGKRQLEGTITSIDKKGKALVAVQGNASRTVMKSGNSVNVASNGMGGMTTTPGSGPANTRSAKTPAAPSVAAISGPGSAPLDGETNSGPAFETPFHSFAYAGPGQLYQATDTRTDGQITYDASHGTSSIKGATARYDLTGPVLQAGVVADPVRSNLRVAFLFNHQSSDVRVKVIDKSGASTINGSLTELSFAPGAGYALSPNIFAGAFYHIVEKDYEGEVFDNLKHSISYARLEVGATWHQGNLEAGIGFLPKVDVQNVIQQASATAAKSSTVREKKAAEVHFHGQIALPQEVTAYSLLSFNQNRMKNVDDDHSWKNNLTITGGAKKLLSSGLGAGGALKIDTPASSSDEEKNLDNLMTYTVAVDVSKKMTGSGSIGTQVSYSYAAGTAPGASGETKMDRDDLALSVTGSYRM